MIQKMRRAFTLLELTFVIMILGIVASIGSEIVVRVYEQYMVQRAQYRASFKTELSAYEIANRLRYAIPGTVYRIRTDGVTKEPLSSDIPAGSTGDDYIGLQWVGYDREGFEATAAATPRKPGWSGFCDLDASNKDLIVTPGSDLDTASTIISNLGGNIAGSKIFFAKDTNTTVDNNISSATGEQIVLTAATNRRMSEHYKLAWTSYALVVVGGDLYLYYDFAPQHATALGTTRSLLLKNVSTFKFSGTENTIRFKICKDEDIGLDDNITACKEKAVF